MIYAQLIRNFLKDQVEDLIVCYDSQYEKYCIYSGEKFIYSIYPEQLDNAYDKREYVRKGFKEALALDEFTFEELKMVRGHMSTIRNKIDGK